MKKVSIKKIVGVVVLLLLILQFFRTEKNSSSTVSENAIEKHYTVPAPVQSLLKTSCYDCHSNNTEYPWYNNIQPVAFWLNSHVKDGKKHLNFDEFNTYSLERKRKKLKEVSETIEKGEMPLPSYTIIHGDAKLSADDIQALKTWANSLAAEL